MGTSARLAVHVDHARLVDLSEDGWLVPPFGSPSLSQQVTLMSHACAVALRLVSHTGRFTGPIRSPWSAPQHADLALIGSRAGRAALLAATPVAWRGRLCRARS